MLSVQNVTKSFGGFLALNQVSFEVHKGEILGLIGPNGSGKSTVFNLISGALPTTSGKIIFDGQEVQSRPPDKICHMGIGRTFQIPRPFRKLDILQNVTLSAYYGDEKSISRQEAKSRAEYALDMVGLPHAENASVDGLGASALKKLELARALSTQPKLLLADESLGGMDHKEMEQAAEMLDRIRKETGITIIWVEHIMGVLMKVVDRVMVLDYGQKIAEGLPEEVTKNPKVIEVYLGDTSALK